MRNSLWFLAHLKKHDMYATTCVFLIWVIFAWGEELPTWHPYYVPVSLVTVTSLPSEMVSILNNIRTVRGGLASDDVAGPGEMLGPPKLGYTWTIGDGMIVHENTKYVKKVSDEIFVTFVIRERLSVQNWLKSLLIFHGLLKWCFSGCEDNPQLCLFHNCTAFAFDEVNDQSARILHRKV